MFIFMTESLTIEEALQEETTKLFLLACENEGEINVEKQSKLLPASNLKKKKQEEEEENNDPSSLSSWNWMRFGSYWIAIPHPKSSDQILWAKARFL